MLTGPAKCGKCGSRNHAEAACFMNSKNLMIPDFSQTEKLMRESFENVVQPRKFITPTGRISYPAITGFDRASKPDMGAIMRYSRSGLHIMLRTGGGVLDIDQMALHALDSGDAVDRELLVMIFTSIASARGAEVKRTDWTGDGILLEFSVNGVFAFVILDDIINCSTSYIGWYQEKNSRIPFTDEFAKAIRDPRYEDGYPVRHKATSHAPDWYGIALLLDTGLSLAARGEALTKPSAL